MTVSATMRWRIWAETVRYYQISVGRTATEAQQ